MFTSIKDVSVAVAELAEKYGYSFENLCILVDYYADEEGMDYEKAYNKIKEWVLNDVNNT